MINSLPAVVKVKVSLALVPPEMPFLIHWRMVCTNPMYLHGHKMN
jgi:hypothetical protein